jgi:hypothetical protein
MGNHRTAAGILQIILGAIVLFFAWLLYRGFFSAGQGAAGQSAGVVFAPDTVNIAVTILCLLSLPFIVSGLAILKGVSWHRPLAWVTSVIGLFVMVPIGTAISAYVIWALVKTRPHTEAFS